METKYIAERVGNFCQIYHSGLKKVIRRIPYSEYNFTMIIRTAHRLGIEDWIKETGRSLPVNNGLQNATNGTKLEEGVTTMELELTTLTLPSKREIAEKVKEALESKQLSVTYRPTNKTLVHMMLPHPEYKCKSSTGKNIVFRASSSFRIQLTEEKNHLDSKLINDDIYTDPTEAIIAFYDQIKFCCKMYGQVQPCILEWN